MMTVRGPMYLSDSESRGGELRKETAEYGGMEIHQQTSLSAERQTGRQLIVVHCIQDKMTKTKVSDVVEE